MPTPVQLAWVEAAADATVWHTHTQRHTHGCNYQPLLHGLPCWLGFSPDSKPFTANTLHFPARSPSLRKPLHIVSCAAAAAATARCNYTLSAVWYLDWLNIWRGFFIPKRRFSGGLKIGPRKQRKDRLLRSPRRKWALLWAQFVSSKTIGGLPAKREGFLPSCLAAIRRWPELKELRRVWRQYEHMFRRVRTKTFCKDLWFPTANPKKLLTVVGFCVFYNLASATHKRCSEATTWKDATRATIVKVTSQRPENRGLVFCPKGLASDPDVVETRFGKMEVNALQRALSSTLWKKQDKQTNKITWACDCGKTDWPKRTGSWGWFKGCC